MDHLLLKKTLLRTLKWYPLVIVVMVVVGTVLVNSMGEPPLAIGLTIMAGVVGPALEAVFYYRTQRQQQQPSGSTYQTKQANSAADRLRQAAELHREGLLSDEAYEHVRQSVIDELSGHSQEGTGEKSAQVVKEKPASSMNIHPWLAILVALSWPAMGFFLVMLLETALKTEATKLVSSGINFVVGCFGVFYLFPSLYRAPFGRVPLPEYLRRIGLYLPAGAWRHVVLGGVLAGCTLSGMLVGSLMTGRYEMNWRTITLEQTVFSLNPGLFEEVFYRGIIMLLLIPMTRSLWKAAAGQILIFGLAHIKGFGWEGLLDTISVAVIALAFTYAAYKTRTLLAGIVFHFLHDALLFFVQVPDGVYHGYQELALFYGALWLMVGVGCFIIWFATERLKVFEEQALYPSPGERSTAPVVI